MYENKKEEYGSSDSIYDIGARKDITILEVTSWCPFYHTISYFLKEEKKIDSVVKVTCGK